MQEAKKQPSRAELLAHIRETYLFENLDEDVLQDLSKDLTWVSLEPGENLFHQGDHSDSTYLVIDGHLKVAINLDDGSEMFVGENKPGQLVGEMGVFTGQNRTASIY
ncbi:MAG: cyclic nucleotide-binding domain-containing protein, partial [Candidatus Latescibacteria bacterium]|nr:cyclic nucleotide-binding domain-containing protein [Candidatus Latescibacterota bacterium]